MEFFEQFLSRRDTARDEFLNRTQIAAFVLATGVEPAAPCQALLSERERRGGKLQHGAPRDGRGKSDLRHVVTQFLAFCGSPILDQLPGGVERPVVVKNAGPVGR